jgi:uncharacterized protein YuzE
VEVSYDAKVDILSIVLAPRKVKESKEVTPGVVVDFDWEGRVTAFEIFDASKVAELSQVKVAVSHPEEKYGVEARPD